MKYLRFSDHKGSTKYGVLDGDTVREIKGDVFGDHGINEIK